MSENKHGSLITKKVSVELVNHIEYALITQTKLYCSESVAI